jgi:predicted DNA binding CopG/RHH family protein
MPKSKQKTIPEFASEAEEQEFWATADTTEYFDWSQARRVVFPNLKPTTTPISMRFPETLLADLKRLANEQDVPYQSLIKVYLAERVAKERLQRRRNAKAGS